MILKLNAKSYNINSFNIVAFLIGLSFLSCKTTKLTSSSAYQINFLDEYILENNMTFDGFEVGGLSGLDFNGDEFILISDKSRNPDLYKVDIQIDHYKIQSITFKTHQTLKCDFIKYFDAESIRFLPDNSGYLLSTEGRISVSENAQILEVDNTGKCRKSYTLPKHFNINYFNKPRNNGVFEGLTIDNEKQGFWVVNELPLNEDGHRPKLYNTFSPLRITHYKLDSYKSDFQFSYDLERLVKIPLLPFGLNGATEILQIDKKHLLLIERSFSAGHGSRGNRIKIFLVDISSAKNILDRNRLKQPKAQSISKSLIFDSKTIRKELEYKFIDNIEGISFGPNLPNGNKSLILVSDNNFNAIGKQLNQFILLELTKSD